MIDDNLEEGIHQQDTVRLDGGSIQQDRFRRSVETVAIQDGLYHDKGLR